MREIIETTYKKVQHFILMRIMRKGKPLSLNETSYKNRLQLGLQSR